MTTPTDEKKWCFQEETFYEYTQTYEDRYQSLDAKDRYKACRARANGILKAVSHTIEYVCTPELSHTQCGPSFPRFHIHGIIRIRKGKMLEFLSETVLLFSKYGRYQFNEYRPDYWKEYITKDKWMFTSDTYYLSNTYSLEEAVDEAWRRTKGGGCNAIKPVGTTKDERRRRVALHTLVTTPRV